MRPGVHVDDTGRWERKLQESERGSGETSWEASSSPGKRGQWLASHRDTDKGGGSRDGVELKNNTHASGADKGLEGQKCQE